MQTFRWGVLYFCLLLVFPFPGKTQQQPRSAADAQALADKLANPVASMISVPFQNNTDWGIGPANGSKNTLNIQPVIPVKITSNLNLISRFIMPVVDQIDVTEPGSHQFGLSDLSASAWFTSSHPKNGFIWGGRTGLINTHSNRRIPRHPKNRGWSNRAPAKTGRW